MHTPALLCSVLPGVLFEPLWRAPVPPAPQQLVLEPAKRGKEFTKIYESRSYGFAYWMAEQAEPEKLAPPAPAPAPPSEYGAGALPNEPTFGARLLLLHPAV
jgi:hypothetical protein